MLDVKVGDVVILRESYGNKPQEVVITSETRKSFVISQYRRERKFSKQDGQELASSWGEGRIYSLEQYQKGLWISKHRTMIADMVRRCDDVEKLQKIQDLLLG